MVVVAGRARQPVGRIVQAFFAVSSRRVDNSHIDLACVLTISEVELKV